MAEPDLRFIGERLDKIPTELRELWALKTGVTPLAERRGRLESKLDHVASKVETLDAKVGVLDAKVDAVDRLLGARMDRYAAQAATNLQIALAALQDKPVQRRLRSC
jgi:outer membrane murein-binding lipoprotein Lpp